MKNYDPFLLRDEGPVFGAHAPVESFEDLIASEADPSFVSPSVGPHSMRRLMIVFGACGFGLLIWILYLQIARGNTYRQLAEGNRIRRIAVAAPRGEVYDRTGRALIRNTPAFRVEIDWRTLSAERTEVLRRFIDDLSTNHAVRVQLSTADKMDKITLHDVEPTVALALRSMVVEGDGALQVEPEPARDYLLGAAAGHVTGYLGAADSVDIMGRPTASGARLGRYGIEALYEKLLTGLDGEQLIEVDVRGRPHKVYGQRAPIVGRELALTIDYDLQRTAAQALETAMTQSGGTGGAIVAIDTRDCAIRALVSLPAPDPNIFVSGADQTKINNLLSSPYKPFFNRAISGQYAPGSTIKPFFAYAGLAEGIITPTTTILSTGGLRVGQWFFPDWKMGGHGVVEVHRAIAESINTFFYLLGGGSPDHIQRTGRIKGLGIERMGNYLRQFGFGRITGTNFSNEADGLIPTPEWKEKTKNEAWYIGDTYHVAIGQGDLLVSPLQLAMGYAAIANGDHRCVPYINVQSKSENVPIDFNQDALQTVRAGLRQTVTAGSAWRLAALSITSAGKTGTAQVAGQKRTNAWYAGYAPYESPEIAFAILIENAGEGGIYATPIAQALLQTYWEESQILNPKP